MKAIQQGENFLVSSRFILLSPTTKLCRVVWWWGHMPLIPALWRQRQADLCEFKVSLVYRTSTKICSKATQETCLKKQTNKACVGSSTIGSYQTHIVVNKEQWP